MNPTGAEDLGKYFFNYYNDVLYADTVQSTVAYAYPNPFNLTSALPVADFNYRVVSASLEVIPMNPPTA